ncbi:hypothetical protein [Actinomycetospora sp. CA-084318]|uniref:hypothetical protein n=1 Tax=Actinomycetospora sp. CA-084318 TaxID=3239892 RepID=UPI003D98F7AF
MTPDNNAWVAPRRLRVSTIGYGLRLGWTFIAVGALVRIAVVGPYTTLFGSTWLIIGMVLLAADVLVWLTLLALERLRPQYGRTAHATPVVTALLAAATIVPGSINTGGASIVIAVVLIALTAYTVIAHAFIVRKTPAIK